MSIKETYIAEIKRLCDQYLPSKHSFFAVLRSVDSIKIKNPDVLGELYLRYQAGMHATRVMVYKMPYLDSPDLRKKKLQIYVDDDGLPGGDTHHYQLSRAFQRLGARLPLKDDDFGDLALLAKQVDPKTAEFILTVSRTYTTSLGTWAIVELLSNDWLHALCSGLQVHFSDIASDPYFEECFSHHVEERHGNEALETSCYIVEKRPELLDQALLDAKVTAKALNSLWDGLEDVIRNVEYSPSALSEGTVYV